MRQHPRMGAPFEMHDRLPVWTALSVLFLDTELDEHDHHRIAEILNTSPYSRADLEAILRDEVAPVFRL